MPASHTTIRNRFATMAAVIFPALSGGCAGIPGAGGPVILSGVHWADQRPQAVALQNGWRALPNSQVELTADALPRIPSTNVVMTYDTSMEGVELTRRCGDRSIAYDSARYAECATATLPKTLILAFPSQVVYAVIRCAPPYPIVARSPGNNRVDTYMRADCATTGDYAVKSSSTGGEKQLVIYRGRPVMGY